MSRIGKLPITLPAKVAIKISDSLLQVEGPKGKLDFQIPSGVEVTQQDGTVEVKRLGETRRHRALHGTVRAVVSNMVKGVADGFMKEMEILGVGYRAAVKGNELDLQLGYSHEVKHPIPAGLTVTVEENTKIKVQGIDKQAVGQFAAEVRSYRPPEPYKGKGIRYKGEFVRRKAGKSVQK